MSKLAKALTAAAGNAGGESLYVEDVFSTYLYDGVSSAITITNGIDLADAGGLVWTKRRATDARSHILFDSERGASSRLMTDQTAAAANQPYSITMNSNGYSWSGADNDVTIAGSTYASWTFRKAEKFFDVVTWTGDGSTTTHNHNLGSTPAVIIVKRTDSTSNWSTYHKDATDGVRSGEDLILYLNTTAAAAYLGVSPLWAATDSTFTTVGGGNFNASGGTYVAYLFASDAGGFGDDGSESIIKCGSFTGNGGSQEINLGFEPQFLIIKNASSSSTNWMIMDNMRGLGTTFDRGFGTEAVNAQLRANTNGAETNSSAAVAITSTGFETFSGNGEVNGNGNTLIYIAIRRPMKTPESGTEVFAVDDRAAATPAFVSDFPVDLYWRRSTIAGTFRDYARLRGDNYLQHDGINAETSGAAFFDLNTGVVEGGSASTTDLAWMFKRATGFFDVVAYTGTGSNTTQSHNLGVAPEMIIVKRRSSVEDWLVYHSATGNQAGTGLNQTNATFTGVPQYWNSTSPTDSVFSLGTHGRVNTSAETYIAYLFATLAGVSKVGSYTGTGSNVNVDCGFSAGARFILIKRTDSTGDWYVYDYFRGITSGNDPYLLLNTGTGEVTSTDYIDPLSSGFTVTSSAPAALNASGGTYIFLAIA